MPLATKITGYILQRMRTVRCKKNLILSLRFNGTQGLTRSGYLVSFLEGTLG